MAINLQSDSTLARQHIGRHRDEQHDGSQAGRGSVSAAGRLHGNGDKPRCHLIQHTGTNAASEGTEFIGVVLINDYEIELPTTGAPETAASLATYLNSMLAMPSAGFASLVHVSYAVLGSLQYLDLSATADASI